MENTEQKKESSQKLNLFGLCVFGIGIIIGAGVYAILGIAASKSGTSLALSFLLAAVVALLTGLSYCELGTLFPKAAAEYYYLKIAYPKKGWMSFALASLLILAGCATSATVAVAFGSYIQEFIKIPGFLSALILMIVLTGVNLLGIQGSSRTNMILTFIEILGLVIVVWFGMTTEAPVKEINFEIHAGTFSAAALIFFVYLGFEDIVNLAEDTNKPDKNIPKAIIISLIVTSLLYMAVAIAVMRLATPETLSSSKTPLSTAISKVAPNWIGILNGIALVSMANTVLITMLAVGRMVFGVAKDNQLPQMFAKTSQKKMVPSNAILLTLGISGLFLLLSGLDELANVASLCALWGFLVVNWVAIVLRYKKPELKRSFRVPLNIGKFPVLSGLGCLTCLALLTQFKLKIHLVILGVMILSVGAQFLIKSPKRFVQVVKSEKNLAMILLNLLNLKKTIKKNLRVRMPKKKLKSSRRFS